jgi:hypothetical protein
MSTLVLSPSFCISPPFISSQVPERIVIAHPENWANNGTIPELISSFSPFQLKKREQPCDNRNGDQTGGQYTEEQCTTGEEIGNLRKI